MKKTCSIRRQLVRILLILSCLLSACAPKPSNAQIEAAIRATITSEASPPALEFEGMQVPMRSAGSASAVLWTADDEIQRNYALEYDKKDSAFAVTGFTTSRKSADGTYYPVPNDLSLEFTELASCFDFSDDFAQKYMLQYVGEGNDLAAIRAAFESEKLPELTAEQLASFAVCDLGGDTLILLVPRYKGLSVWINELEHRGDMMISGAEVARFEDLPVYIYCSFSDELPSHEIHVSFDGLGEFFTTRESLLTNIK